MGVTYSKLAKEGGMVGVCVGAAGFGPHLGESKDAAVERA